MTTIVFEDVWKEYDERIVLERVNLSLADHEFLVIIGPSGVGKTTLLRMLLSQEQPSRGRILIDGEPIAPEPTADRGVVFQRYSVFPHLTVLANVMRGPQWVASPFLGRLFGARRRALEAEAMALLERVGLAEHAAKYPQQLSGGMQQRLALAQALIMKPKVLLLDEPFGALDPGTRKSMHELVRDLWEEHRMTIVMVTHDLAEAFLLGTRVIAVDRPRKDPQAPERFGATIASDFEAKCRIVRESRRFEAARAEARLQLVSSN
ncbi:ABC transporter ATP-binding protein [Ancylobacter lacus]|uniref:ABC transporter ATP-binding protein n=1 Tax=Ancylobacter lacus TaxID=2579970 RepID=UPI001BD04AB5|nr:ABC transporter ATP-binding protein [Ancylobacter lacus]MBS7538815.1 ABC transporter ATP-binding protein [Ancylobacter lacus]